MRYKLLLILVLTCLLPGWPCFAKDNTLYLEGGSSITIPEDWVIYRVDPPSLFSAAKNDTDGTELAAIEVYTFAGDSEFTHEDLGKLSPEKQDSFLRWFTTGALYKGETDFRLKNVEFIDSRIDNLHGFLAPTVAMSGDLEGQRDILEFTPIGFKDRVIQRITWLAEASAEKYGPELARVAASFVPDNAPAPAASFLGRGNTLYFASPLFLTLPQGWTLYHTGAQGIVRAGKEDTQGTPVVGISIARLEGEPGPTSAQLAKMSKAEQTAYLAEFTKNSLEKARTGGLGEAEVIDSKLVDFHGFTAARVTLRGKAPQKYAIMETTTIGVEGKNLQITTWCFEDYAAEYGATLAKMVDSIR